MRNTYFILSFLFLSNLLHAQNKKPPFLEEIQSFKIQDSISSPSKNQILFIGSSSFTKWTDVQSYFPSHKILNRGFGGSTLADIITYSNDVIFKYDPKQIVIYCGENDFAASDTITIDTVVNRFKKLYKIIRDRYKKINLVYISMKPSPSRISLIKKFEEANTRIKKFLSKKRRTNFIDVYHPMLNTEGLPDKEIFTDDNLHINTKGYAIWQKIIEPFLAKSK